MAGIMANSASATMVSGDTAADNTASGYLTKERISLSVTGGSTFVWSLSKPSASGSAVALQTPTAATSGFAPDADGYYVVTCLVDGTTLYVLRLAIADVSPVATMTALRFIPVANATVPAPAAGATLFYSIEEDALAQKLPNGTVSAI